MKTSNLAITAIFIIALPGDLIWSANQKVGIASFCPWNIGPGSCFPSTFNRKTSAGDRLGACAEFKRWIWNGGKDCRIRGNNCAGQVIRRDQESELTCWGLDE